jgi:hypothetical protein
MDVMDRQQSIGSTPLDRFAEDGVALAYATHTVVVSGAAA